MKLIELIKIVKDNSLIETVSDIEFLFLDYSINDENQPISILIDNVITWGYENDELGEFYSKYSDFLIDSGIIQYTIGCTIILTHSIRTLTTFELYSFESNNQLYYQVIGTGEYSDCLESSEFIMNSDKNSNIDIISMFKNRCYEVFTNNGEFDSDELLSNGHKIEFYT